MWKVLGAMIATLGVLWGIIAAIDARREPERERLRKLSDACGVYSSAIGRKLTDAEWDKAYDPCRDAASVIPAMKDSYPKLNEAMNYLSTLGRVRDQVQAACRKVQLAAQNEIRQTYLIPLFH
jgi:hypothetical protein